MTHSVSQDKKSLGSEWYYAHQDQSCGPVTGGQLLDLLNKGSIQLHTLVWTEEWQDWAPLGEISEQLKVHHAEVSQEAEKETISQAQAPSRPSSKFGLILICLGLWFGIKLGLRYLSKSDHLPAKPTTVVKDASIERDGPPIVEAGEVQAVPPLHSFMRSPFAGRPLFGLHEVNIPSFIEAFGKPIKDPRYFSPVKRTIGNEVYIVKPIELAYPSFIVMLSCFEAGACYVEKVSIKDPSSGLSLPIALGKSTKEDILNLFGECPQRDFANAPCEFSAGDGQEHFQLTFYFASNGTLKEVDLSRSLLVVGD